MRSQRARVRHFVRRVRDRGQVVRVRVQYPGEVQRHVYGHGVVERGFCFQLERLRARGGCYVSGPVRVLNVSAFGNVCAPGA
jgi:hypothetical protein